MKKLFLTAFLFLSFSCAHSIHMVQATSFDTSEKAGKSRVIEARSKQFVVMDFVTQTDYADEAYEILLSQCPNGRIEGVVTQFSTSLGFFSWTNKILMKGLCFSNSL